MKQRAFLIFLLSHTFKANYMMSGSCVMFNENLDFKMHGYRYFQQAVFSFSFIKTNKN